MKWGSDPTAQYTGGSGNLTLRTVCHLHSQTVRCTAVHHLRFRSMLLSKYSRNGKVHQCPPKCVLLRLNKRFRVVELFGRLNERNIGFKALKGGWKESCGGPRFGKLEALGKGQIYKIWEIKKTRK